MLDTYCGIPKRKSSRKSPYQPSTREASRKHRLLAKEATNGFWS